MDVYLASRAIRVYPAHADELGLLVYPTVEASFVKRAGLLHHLEQALAHDPRFADHPDATALRDAVRQRVATTTTGQQEPQGKAVANRPALAALFADNGPALRDDLDPSLLDAVESSLLQHRHGLSRTGNPRYDRLVMALLEQLSHSPEWMPPVSTHFTALLDQVVRFLHIRFDAQADLYGTITRYLGPCPPDKDGKARLWPEETIQDDLHQHLSIALTPGTIQREVIDIAGGRTDITYTPQPGTRFVVEVKRRPSKATRIAVERDYLPQATNYTLLARPSASSSSGTTDPTQPGTPASTTASGSPPSPAAPPKPRDSWSSAFSRSDARHPVTSPRRKVTAGMTKHPGERDGRRSQTEGDRCTDMFLSAVHLF